MAGYNAIVKVDADLTNDQQRESAREAVSDWAYQCDVIDAAPLGYGQVMLSLSITDGGSAEQAHLQLTDWHTETQRDGAREEWDLIWWKGNE